VSSDQPPDIEDVADVEELVRAFYRVAIPDDLLGPIFEAAGIEWDVHIPKIASWWSRELLAVDGHVANMVQVHLRVADHRDYGGVELDRWVELFTETVEERFAGPVADRAVARARQVALTLGRALARRSGPSAGLLLGPGGLGPPTDPGASG
jgi:hemoglobin